MRETAIETAADTVVLLVEQEDEWFAVVRLDDGGDPRVFLSDAPGDPDQRPRTDARTSDRRHRRGTPTDDPVGDPGLLPTSVRTRHG